MSQRHQILLETTATRDRAEALLRALMDCKAQSERNLVELKQADTFKSVTGRSALDNAIASTQRMIESLNRVISHAKKELSSEDLSLLEEIARNAQEPPKP
jgi:hypothetical protein